MKALTNSTISRIGIRYKISALSCVQKKNLVLLKKNLTKPAYSK